MEDWIAGAMAVLGTLLVVSGGTVIVLKALGVGAAAQPEPAGDTQYLPTSRGWLGTALHRMSAADRLIGWGIVLLVLGAVAAGAVSVNFGLETGAR